MSAVVERQVEQDEAEIWDAFVEWHTEQFRYAPKPKNFYTKQRYICFVAGAEWQMNRENEK